MKRINPTPQELKTMTKEKAIEIIKNNCPLKEKGLCNCKNPIPAIDNSEWEITEILYNGQQMDIQSLKNCDLICWHEIG
jgi:hypothetical protein